MTKQSGVDQENQAVKLKAVDAEDLQVISTLLQDALVPVNGMAHHKENKTFAFLAFRYKWENTLDKDLKDQHERVHAGIVFSNIDRVEHIGFGQKDHAPHSLNLLMLELKPDHAKLVFSGAGEIRLHGKNIGAHLADMEDPWPITAKPEHDVS